MASITSFSVIAGSITANSAQFQWTLDLDGNAPVGGNYTLTLGTVNPSIRHDVTFTKPPFSLTGLSAGTPYGVFLELALNGTQQSIATVNIVTTGSAPGHSRW